MATDLTDFIGQINLSTQLTASSDAVLGVPNDALNYQYIKTIDFGTGDDQADQMYYENNTTTEADVTYDLYGGLTNHFGETINFATIKGIILRNNSDINSIALGPATADEALLWFPDNSAYEVIPPGGISIHIAPNDGWVIVDGSDSITVEALTAFSGLEPDEAGDYDLIIWGTSD